MGMTKREALIAVIDDMKSNGMASQDQLNTVLLSSIADSLAVIADELHELNSKGDK